MQKITRLFIAVCLSLPLSDLQAQEEIKQCGTSEYMQKLLDTNPQMKLEYEKEELRLAQIDKESSATGYRTKDRAAGTVYIIPVVFHVIHQFGFENISDAQIMDAVKCISEDFRKLNSDTINTTAEFKSIAADCEIEFRLAQKDPNGNCTNGIDRIYSALTNAADDKSKLNPWPRNEYLNVWLVKTIGISGVGGYATPPGSLAATDGILILSDYIGSIGTSSKVRSHTLTHEIGHFFNLRHVWGNGPIGVSCDDTNNNGDNVSDTPPTKGHNNTCPLADQTCNPGVIENPQNFMDYSYCFTMFTAGQATRMHAAINSSIGARNNLWQSTNLTKTGVLAPLVLCKADFQTSNSTNTVCEGNSLTFTDMSWNGMATSWSWDFPGGTPATSTAASPVIQYKSAGRYDVSLTVTNSSGSGSTTKTAFVKVNSSTAKYANSIYSESFEGDTIPNTDWQVNNQFLVGNSWMQTNAAAVTGNNSAYIANDSASDSYIDELISPSIDLTAIGGGAVLTFKVAHAQKKTSSADKLQVYISINCGLNWILRRTLIGAGLSTAGINATWTAPSINEWAEQIINLAGYASQTNLYVKFTFTSNGGNNIYIDDINISSTNGIQERAGNNFRFKVYPNPSEGNALITFDLEYKQEVKIKIYDMLGRECLSVFEGGLNAGKQQFPITENFMPGVYFVKLMIAGQSLTKKLMVE